MSDSNLRAATQRSRFVDLPNGDRLEFRPLIIRDWGTLEEEALTEYRRQWMKFRLSTLDMLDPGIDPETEKQAIRQQAEALTLDDCADKEFDGPAFDSRREPISAGSLKVGDVIETHAGPKPVVGFIGEYAAIRQKMPYVNWWLSRTTKGRFMSIWLSVRKARPTMTFDQCCELFTSMPAEVQTAAADTVGDLSKPTVGNE